MATIREASGRRMWQILLVNMLRTSSERKLGSLECCSAPRTAEVMPGDVKSCLAATPDKNKVANY